MAKNVKIIPGSGSLSFEPEINASTSAIELSLTNNDLSITSGSILAPGSSDLVVINKDRIEIDDNINLNLPINTLSVVPVFNAGRIVFDNVTDNIVVGTGAGNITLEGPQGPIGNLGPVGPDSNVDGPRGPLGPIGPQGNRGPSTEGPRGPLGPLTEALAPQ